eukprot:86825_1
MGPFGREELSIYYHSKEYKQIFAKGLSDCEGMIQIKQIGDSKWSSLDEVGLCLLMNNFKSNPTKDGIDAYITSLYHDNYGLYIYRYGSFGAQLHGPLSPPAEFKKSNQTIYIKRVGDEGWYPSNDIDLHILFYHLTLHRDTYQVPMPGIQHIQQAIHRAHHQRLEPHFPYNAWNIIKSLMKEMRCDQYFDELQSYCKEQEYEDFESICEDLEEFVTSEDYDYDGSCIIDHFRTEYDYESTENEEEDSKQVDGYDEDTNDNDTKGIREQKWIKLGFVLYDAIQLLPVFKAWCDIVNETYLEKHFSYARCARHMDDKQDLCPYIERLFPLARYIDVWNKDICYVSDAINARAPFWITHRAFLAVLPHYNHERLRKDWEHVQRIIIDTMGFTEQDELGDMFMGLDFLMQGMKDGMDEVSSSRAVTMKIFELFDRDMADMKCKIEDCHTTNRKCFPVKSHPPYPFPFHWKRKAQRTRRECDATRTLDELHHLVHHSDSKFKYLKTENDAQLANIKQFEQIKRAANKRYYHKEAPELYYFEDNKVGAKSIEGITDLTPNKRAFQ